MLKNMNFALLLHKSEFWRGRVGCTGDASRPSVIAGTIFGDGDGVFDSSATDFSHACYYLYYLYVMIKMGHC